MAGALGLPISDAQISGLAYEIEKLHHGMPSGIDNTVVTYARPVFFMTGHPIEILRVGAPITIVIADTGIPAPTKVSIRDVRTLWESDRTRWEAVFDTIGNLALQARAAIEKGLKHTLAQLMDQNQALLARLTVSSPELDRLCYAAHKAGALGAKLSGGGRGGNMIALVNDGMAEKVAAALKSAGSPHVLITTVQASP
jgi:mevalonate kinase